ncbi:peptidase domain-containing ABC transporter [uncultured Alteromonas sp.]|uniref:peptidase domain-containing ABC transporter n=1 Tax=uncultured Alteromonas sp. TaxID=179113 RepID=UPI0030EB5268|tara:strand:+ start:47618 stop:49693 length:2076 start_codon:yes stop_codon:yes gene_type:complete
MFAKKFPNILQSEAAECGLACLAMVANFYGKGLSLFEMRERHAVSLKGLTIKDLMFISDHLEFNSRAVQLNLDELPELTLPAVLYWNFDHFVVLKEVKKGRFYINDPAIGERSFTIEQISKHFTGVALEIFPKNNFAPKKPKPAIRFNDLITGFNTFWKSISIIMGLSFVMQVFLLTIPFFAQISIDNILISEDTDFLIVLGIGFVFVSLFKSLAWLIRGYQVVELSAKLNLHVLSSVFRHLMGLPHEYFAKRHMGDVQSRFKSFEVISQTLTTDWVESIVDGIFLVFTLLIMALYSPLLASISMVSILVYYLSRRFTLQPYISKTNEAIICKAREDTLFLESLRGIVPLKNFGQESKRLSVWANAFVKSLNSNIGVQKTQIGYASLFQLTSGLEYILIVWLGITMVLDSTLTVGMLVALFAYQQRVSEHSKKLVDNWFEMKYLIVHFQRMSDILKSKQESHLEGKLNYPLAFEHFKVERITYNYSSLEEPTLSDVSFEVKRGEIVCLVGPSGCGKSTLLKVMVGLIQPQRGQVSVDDVCINDIGLKNYRQQISAMMQEDSLFSGSLRDNITMFDPSPDTKHLHACCKVASIYNEIMNMPMAFSTLVGDMGNTLSGGQKQRILLARALYQSPKILFLDEATSHLDPIRERKVNRALKKLGITTIMIAHRKETIELADRVIDLNSINSLSVD